MPPSRAARNDALLSTDQTQALVESNLVPSEVIEAQVSIADSIDLPDRGQPLHVPVKPVAPAQLFRGFIHVIRPIKVAKFEAIPYGLIAVILSTETGCFWIVIDTFGMPGRIRLHVSQSLSAYTHRLNDVPLHISIDDPALAGLLDEWPWLACRWSSPAHVS